MLGPMTDQADVHYPEGLLEFPKYSEESSNKISHSCFSKQNDKT